MIEKILTKSGHRTAFKFLSWLVEPAPVVDPWLRGGDLDLFLL